MVDIVMGEEEGQDLDEEEEGVVKEIEDGEAEVSTKTAGDNGFGDLNTVLGSTNYLEEFPPIF